MWTLTVDPRELICLRRPKKSKGNQAGTLMTPFLAYYHHNSLYWKKVSRNLSCFRHTHTHTLSLLYFTHLQE